jgi:hypothetical protein
VFAADAKTADKDLFELKQVADGVYAAIAAPRYKVNSNAAVIPHRASGYVVGKDGFENAGYIHMSIPHGAGALYSTTEDLLRWEQGLFGGKLLSAASLAKMITPFKNDYACGVAVRTLSGRSASSMAEQMAAGAPMVPLSAAPLTPSGLSGVGDSM